MGKQELINSGVSDCSHSNAAGKDILGKRKFPEHWNKNNPLKDAYVPKLKNPKEDPFQIPKKGSETINPDRNEALKIISVKSIIEEDSKGPVRSVHISNLQKSIRPSAVRDSRGYASGVSQSQKCLTPPVSASGDYPFGYGKNVPPRTKGQCLLSSAPKSHTNRVKDSRQQLSKLNYHSAAKESVKFGANLETNGVKQEDGVKNGEKKSMTSSTQALKESGYLSQRSHSNAAGKSILGKRSFEQHGNKNDPLKDANVTNLQKPKEIPFQIRKKSGETINPNRNEALKIVSGKSIIEEDSMGPVKSVHISNLQKSIRPSAVRDSRGYASPVSQSQKCLTPPVSASGDYPFGYGKNVPPRTKGQCLLSSASKSHTNRVKDSRQQLSKLNYHSAAKESVKFGANLETNGVKQEDGVKNGEKKSMTSSTQALKESGYISQRSQSNAAGKSILGKRSFEEHGKKNDPLKDANVTNLQKPKETPFQIRKKSGETINPNRNQALKIVSGKSIIEEDSMGPVKSVHISNLQKSIRPSAVRDSRGYASPVSQSQKCLTPPVSASGDYPFGYGKNVPPRIKGQCLLSSAPKSHTNRVKDSRQQLSKLNYHSAAKESVKFGANLETNGVKQEDGVKNGEKKSMTSSTQALKESGYVSQRSHSNAAGKSILGKRSFEEHGKKNDPLKDANVTNLQKPKEIPFQIRKKSGETINPNRNEALKIISGKSIIEEDSKGPMKIQKPNRPSAVRDFPPGCGRSQKCLTPPVSASGHYPSGYGRNVPPMTKEQCLLASAPKTPTNRVKDGRQKHSKLNYHSTAKESVKDGVKKGEKKNMPSSRQALKESSRSKFRETLRLCRALYRKNIIKDPAVAGKCVRVDLRAFKFLRDNNMFINTGKQIVGAVPGLEVGDEFHYRTELCIVGLHRQVQGGIDFMKQGNVKVATSIVVSGGYEDDLDGGDVLIYTGQGGNNYHGDKTQSNHQKLEHGNLALKNNIDKKVPVRVIRGFKQKNTGNQAKEDKLIYTYDGLYDVEKYWLDNGVSGYSVFKFRLRRQPGQPKLGLKTVKFAGRAKKY